MTVITSFKRGDTGELGTLETSEGGSPIDLSGVDFLVKWQVRPSPDSDVYASAVLDFTDAAIGRIRGWLPAAVTASMTPGVWVSDIEVTSLPEDMVLSSITFEIVVVADVTRVTV